MTKLTLRTKTQVKVNARTGQEEIVYMDILDVIYNFQWYTARIEYYYKAPKGTGQYEEVTDPVTQEVTQVEIMGTEDIHLDDALSNFTRAQARTIQFGIQGGLTGTDHSENYDQLIYAGAMYELSQTPAYGLSVSGWEIVTPE